MFKKVFFGDVAMQALKNSKGERVIEGRVMLVEQDGKKVWSFVPYNRQPRKKPLVLTLKDLANGWIT